jgi:hypothetical protein
MLFYSISRRQRFEPLAPAGSVGSGARAAGDARVALTLAELEAEGGGEEGGSSDDEGAAEVTTRERAWLGDTKSTPGDAESSPWRALAG